MNEGWKREEIKIVQRQAESFKATAAAAAAFFIDRIEKRRAAAASDVQGQRGRKSKGRASLETPRRWLRWISFD